MRLSTLTTLVAEHAGAGDRDGRLAPPVVDALRASGLFGALVPRARRVVGPVSSVAVGGPWRPGSRQLQTLKAWWASGF